MGIRHIDTSKSRVMFRVWLAVSASFMTIAAGFPTWAPAASDGGGLGSARISRLAASIRLSVVSQNLPAVIGEIAQQSGFGLDVAGALPGTVKHQDIQGTSKETLDQLAATYGFVWYADNNMLFVSPLADQVTAELPAPDVPLAALTKRLTSLGVDGERWPLRKSADADAVVASGPRSYVALVKSVIETMHSAPPAAASGLPVVYRGPPVGAGA